MRHFPLRGLLEWETRLDAIAPSLIQSLSLEGPVEIISAFAQPWCLAAAGIVTGADPAHHGRLLALSREVSDSAAEPLDEALQARASAASAELDHYFSARRSQWPERHSSRYRERSRVCSRTVG
jgi:hypothetical protein